jgi:hypothetical protein
MPVDQSERPRPSAAIVVRALGRRVRISATGPGAQAFSSAFAGAWGHLVDGHPLDVTDERAFAVPDGSARTVARHVAAATAEVTRAAIEGNIGTGLLLHAAAMIEGSGATVMVGPPGAGKTTAIGHFGRHHGYLTDELALIRADGRVAPYPKPLEVITTPGPFKAQLAPEAVGLMPAPSEDLPLKRLIILDRHAGADSTASTTRLGLAEGILALAPRISRLTATPRSLEMLARLIAGIGGVERLSYSSIRDLDARSGPPSSAPLSAGELAFSTPLTASAEAARPGDSGATIARADADDAIDTTGMLLVAHGDRIVALVGASRSIWFETARPRSPESLLESLRRTHGARRGDSDIADSLVRGLTEQGILRWPE